MLYHLLYPLHNEIGVFRLFNYISFRAAGAFVTALLATIYIGRPILRRLRNMALHQVVREGTPDSHKAKATTPTMGGLMIITSAIVPTLLWAKLNNRYVVLALVVTAWMCGIGFLDDYLKLKQKREGKQNRGLVERYKLAGQFTIGVALGVYLLLQPPWRGTVPADAITLPFFKYVLVYPWWSWLYVPFVTFVLIGVSNAVNLTDGLDGLAAGLSAISFATFAIFAYLFGRTDAAEYFLVFYLRDAGELSIFCLATVAACIGFLWYNAYPALVFMGDTGSLALGGALGVVAILLKSEFLLLMVGGVFVAETLSVILQRTVFKIRRRRHGLEYAQKHRVFLRAPLHHHFELSGWPETQVVVRFWIIGILFSILALSTLKLR
ncbi:MAG TPA: phospho-N-acetylmuramoyl-pentapeptide-transferase [Gemmatimonadaceae bacterium]|nr:phospho-N-acetylmuramoyl-pentapeptide-transferase [Gemmatimonadaceae bacterium]